MQKYRIKNQFIVESFRSLYQAENIFSLFFHRKKRLSGDGEEKG